jgi:hypothetical protein
VNARLAWLVIVAACSPFSGTDDERAPPPPDAGASASGGDGGSAVDASAPEGGADGGAEPCRGAWYSMDWELGPPTNTDRAQVLGTPTVGRETGNAYGTFAPIGAEPDVRLQIAIPPATRTICASARVKVDVVGDGAFETLTVFPSVTADTWGVAGLRIVGGKQDAVVGTFKNGTLTASTVDGAPPATWQRVVMRWSLGRGEVSIEGTVVIPSAPATVNNVTAALGGGVYFGAAKADMTQFPRVPARVSVDDVKVDVTP